MKLSQTGWKTSVYFNIKEISVNPEMLFDPYIIFFITKTEFFFNKSILFLKTNTFGTLIDLLVITLIVLSICVLVEYIKSYRKCNSCPTKKHTDNDFIYNVEECPICLSEFTSPVRIDCGHAYCLSCIVTYFKTNNFRWKCVCPLCKILVKNVIILHNYAGKELQGRHRLYQEKCLKDMLKQQSAILSLCTYIWENMPVKLIMAMFVVLFLLVFLTSLHVKISTYFFKTYIQTDIKE